MILIQRGAAEAISGFQVFGERCSGTNFIETLIAANFPQLQQPCVQWDKDICVQWRYGWKHGFPTAPILPTQVLFVGIFRHPETWLTSLHQTPWHVAPQLAGKSFSDFIRAEWHCIANNPGFGGRWGTPEYGMELNLDRHPLTGVRFGNVLELRAAKNIGFLSLRNRAANCVFVRYEDVRNDPRDFTEEIAAAFDLRPTPVFQPIRASKGRAAPFRPAPHIDLTPVDRSFMWGVLDREIEASLGYEPLGH